MELENEYSMEELEGAAGAVEGDGSSPSTVETIVEEAPRPIMTTPLDDYTVTEGLLLLILLWLVCSFLWDKVRSVF